MIFDSITILQTAGAPLPAHIDGTITANSRTVRPGDIFVAVRGTAVDAHRFIPDAVEAGARVVVCETLPHDIDPNTSYVCVADSALALGQLADAFYGHPSRQLALVGVTGTNGKTTIATLLYEMARMRGLHAGLISTVENRIDDTVIPTHNTTPDALTLHSLMRRMVDAGCTVAFMEVSSHAQVQKRTAGLTFAGGIFTNLTRDHLDYHKTVEAYRDAKKSFFDMLPPDAFALTNSDDRNGAFMLQNTRAKRYTYGLQGSTDYSARIVESHLDGTLLDIDGTQVHTLFTGRYNAQNLLAVFAAARLMGVDRDTALCLLSRLVPVAGRFETIRSPRNGVVGIVDYAHTPDAIQNVLRAIDDIRTSQRIITVVGCGGNRDHGKRPMMTKAALQGSDIVIVTTDNPRDEEPADIARDMMAQLTPADLFAPDGSPRVLEILDRRQAIRTAVAMAHPGDIILVAGKGHETYQEVRGVRHHFDDREELRDIFNAQPHN